jgi:hypothetical protein
MTVDPNREFWTAETLNLERRKQNPEPGTL